MSEQPLRVALIIGSTRQGRFGSVVANWVAAQAAVRVDLTLDVIDLVDVDLPSAYPGQRSPAISAYVERIRLADAFFAELHVVTMRDTVSFHNAHGAFDGSGPPREPEGPNLAAATMLGQLVWWATALRVARAGDATRREAA